MLSKIIKCYLFFQILFSDTCFTAQALVRLFVDLNEKSLEVIGNGNDRVEEEPQFKDVLATFTLLADRLADCRQLLQVLYLTVTNFKI